jgi:dolichol-phosphate mannosyltransferase
MSESLTWRVPTRVFVVLPAYNEAENLGPLLEEIDLALSEEGLAYTVVLVDDGSADDTLGVARGYQGRLTIEIVEHEQNRGLGETIRDGLRYAAAACGPRDIVIAMDADNTHTPGLIRSMVRLVREGNDVVIASRYQRGAYIRGVPFHRQLLSLGASWIFRLTFPIRGVRDYTCGYRAYRGTLLQEAFQRFGDDFVEQSGFQCMVDILLKLREMDVIFAEAPLILRYDKKAGASKMKVFQTVVGTLRLLAKRRFATRADRRFARTSKGR